MSERGSIMPALAVVMIGGVLVAALAVEVGRWGAAHREAAFAADVAAESGATMLDETSVRAGVLALDPVLAREAALEAAAGPPARAVDVTVDADLVCVTVTDVFRPRLLGPVGIGDSAVTATGCARPRAG